MWMNKECERVSRGKRDPKKKGPRKEETRDGKGSALGLQDKITCTYLDRLSMKIIIISQLKIHTI